MLRLVPLLCEKHNARSSHRAATSEVITRLSIGATVKARPSFPEQRLPSPAWDFLVFACLAINRRGRTSA